MLIHLALFVLSTSLKVNAKCYNRIVTICDELSELKTHGKDSFQNVVIQKDILGSINRDEPNEVLESAHFAKTPNLEQIYIYGKLRGVLANSFADLKYLNYVNLNGNQLTVLEANAFAGMSAYKIDLRRNNIENMAHQTFSNCSVSELDLSFNKLTNIQYNMLNIRSLRILNMSHNQLSLVVSGAFAESLEELDLSFNYFESLMVDVLKELSNLKRLRLRGNKIQYLAKLTNLESLEYLDVSHNALTDIERKAFQAQTNLKTLYLSHNRIKQLPAEIFGDKKEKSTIRTLLLHRNKLGYLSNSLGDILPELKEISIGGNPWSCSCLTSIREYIKVRDIKQLECDKEYFVGGELPVCLIGQKNFCSEGDVEEGSVDQFLNRLIEYEGCY